MTSVKEKINVSISILRIMTYIFKKNAMDRLTQSQGFDRVCGYCNSGQYDGLKRVAETKKAIDFEQQLMDLESLVTSLESGNLTLEESLNSFEKGIKIARECQKALKTAEQRVELLMQQDDNVISEPFTPENN